jgi:hypothetical protein
MKILELLNSMPALDFMKTVLAWILIIGVFDKVSKGRILKLTDWAIKKFTQLIKIFGSNIAAEFKDIRILMPSPTPNQLKVFAWGNIVIFVLLSSALNIYGLIFLILSSYIAFFENTVVWKFLLGESIGVLFFVLGWLYKGYAYKAAKDGGIDLTLRRG